MNHDPRVTVVVEYMQQKMADRITIRDLARCVNLSPSRLSHLFREQTGSSPGEYLRDFRLDRARLLLETTSLSVREVMVAVGFNDPSHFSRDFQEAYGACPRNWRARFRSPSQPRTSRPEATLPRPRRAGEPS